MKFAVNLNLAYFSGTILEQKEEFLNSSAWKLWQEYGTASFWRIYMNSMFSQSTQAESHLKQEIVQDIVEKESK